MTTQEARDELRTALRQLIGHVEMGSVTRDAVVNALVAWAGSWGVRITQDLAAHLRKAFAKTLKES